MAEGASSALCGENKPQKGLDWHRSQGKAEYGWCLPPPQGTFHTKMLWEGGNPIRWGNAQDQPKKSCPRGDHNPPHIYLSWLLWLTIGLARAALLYPKYLPFTLLPAPLRHLLEVSRTHAVGMAGGCLLGFETDVASVSTI